MLSVRHLQDRVESLVNELTKSVKGISLDHVCLEYNRMYGTTLEADLAVIGHNVALFLKPRENFGFTLLKESRPLIFLPNDFGKQLKAHFEAWDGDLRSALAAAPFQGAGDAPLIFNKSGFNADEFNRAYDILEVEKAKNEMPPENQDNFSEWREVTNLHDLLYFLQAVDEERPEGFPPEELQSICDNLCTGFFDFSRYNLKRPHKDLTRLEMLRKKLGKNEEKVFKVSSKVMKLKFFPMEEENSSQLFVMLRQTKHHRVPIEQFIQKMMDRDNEHDVEKASAKLGEVLDEFSMYFKLSPGFISLRPEVPIDYVIPAFE